MTASPATPGTPLRLVLRVLDHQVVGPEGELLGNVDDLELEIDGDRWVVANLCVGPAALGRRLPGVLGLWTTAVWLRLQSQSDPGPAMVPVGAVSEISSALRVDSAAAEALAGSFGLEQWLRRYVVSRIPGAKGGGDERADEAPSGSTTAGSTAGRPYAGASLSDLVGSRVRDTRGTALGVVTEVLGAVQPGRRPLEGLRVTHLEYGTHATLSELGYDADPRQGPWLVGALVRWWQRENRVAALEDVVDLDLDARTVTVARPGRHPHPHRL
jgi:sporulation protein YlmC with PRC-barrel domain